ncbi:hypothetical protein ANCCEY_01591 [Ancylostoma ceylanicum]|uniref:Uncharacterized protein n=1 Tax=Ancylostoma ceylanicum TaxID=53326 RepID=A0A0D6M752_9BILA|nr:hypothetical protein ANCCEY_01591 [Ancylostoma ceylanicum]
MPQPGPDSQTPPPAPGLPPAGPVFTYPPANGRVARGFFYVARTATETNGSLLATSLNESVPQTEVQMATDTDMFKACCKFYNPCRSNASATMCIHVRRTDFHRFGLETEWNGTGLGNYLIFGDDKAFMSSLATELERDTFTGAQPKAFISMFSEVTDFYLSSQLCSALLLSAASSTFGWWLGFFARNQNAVYYYKSGRPVENFRFLRNEFFL